MLLWLAGEAPRGTGFSFARTDSLRLAFAPGGAGRRQGDRAVSAYREIAEYSTELVVATSALATGAASGLGALAVPLVTLAAIGGGLRATCADNACRAGIQRALRDMEAVPDIAADDLARARLTLKERGGTIRLDPARLSAAVRDGSFARFARDTVLAALPDLSDDPPVRSILTRAVDAALAACMENAEFQTALTRQLLLDAAAAQGVTLRVLERLEQGQARIERDVGRLVDRERDTARQLGLQEGLLIGLARRYLETYPEDFDAALRDVELALQAAAEAKRQDALPGNVGAALDLLFARVQELNGRGAFEEAADALEAEIAASKEREAQEQAARLRLHDRAIMQARFTARPDVAAGHEIARAQLDAGDAAEAALRKRCEALGRSGKRTGSRFDLDVSADLARRCAAAARRPQDAAWWQNALGIALQTQGSRTAGPEGARLLGEAVVAYRAALRVRTEADHPVDWATTMQNLGNALCTQGSRTAGPEGADLLGEAVAAYRAALRVRTEADHPVNWATTLRNLAGALLRQGERTAGAAGTDLLAEAVAAYRDALRVLTEADHPVDWAQTTQTLAVALRLQGARTTGAAGTALLADAVVAYRDALRVSTEADHPVDWAQTTQNLGNALKEQGIRTAGAAGTELMAEAVAAYCDALRVRTEADHPVDWAMTQHNMAEAERDWADHAACADPKAHLEAALRHAEAALTVFDPVDTTYYHDHARWLKDDIQAKLAAL